MTVKPIQLSQTQSHCHDLESLGTSNSLDSRTSNEQNKSIAIRLNAAERAMAKHAKAGPYLTNIKVLGVCFHDFHRHDMIDSHHWGQRITTTFRPCHDTQDVGSFSTSYTHTNHHFVIETAFRGDLPAGAGTTVISEHLSLVRDNGIANLEIKKINNRKTKNEILDRRTREVHPERFRDTPLGKMCLRALHANGISLQDIHVIIDKDFCIDVKLTVTDCQHQ
jgi:hypothetical protein